MFCLFLFCFVVVGCCCFVVVAILLFVCCCFVVVVVFGVYSHVCSATQSRMRFCVCNYYPAHALLALCSVTPQFSQLHADFTGLVLHISQINMTYHRMLRCRPTKFLSGVRSVISPSCFSCCRYSRPFLKLTLKKKKKKKHINTQHRQLETVLRHVRPVKKCYAGTATREKSVMLTLRPVKKVLCWHCDP